MIQANIGSIGWLGCVPTLPNKDNDIVEMKAQFADKSKQSPSMKRCRTFDDWVKLCTALSSQVILQMMNTVEPGEAPPKAKVVSKQIRANQQTLTAFLQQEKPIEN